MENFELSQPATILLTRITRKINTPKRTQYEQDYEEEKLEFFGGSVVSL